MLWIWQKMRRNDWINEAFRNSEFELEMTLLSVQWPHLESPSRLLLNFNIFADCKILNCINDASQWSKSLARRLVSMRIIPSDYPLIKSNIHHKVHKVEFKRFTRNKWNRQQASKQKRSASNIWKRFNWTVKISPGPGVLGKPGPCRTHVLVQMRDAWTESFKIWDVSCDEEYLKHRDMTQVIDSWDEILPRMNVQA